MLCGFFPGLCLPQHLLEDLTSAGGGEPIVIWLSGCTMVHPVQCFPFMFWLQHFSHKIEEWQKGVLIVKWTCWCTKHTLRRGGTNCNMAFWLYYGTPCAVFLPFMFWRQHFSYEIEEWQKGVLIVMWTCWCTKHTLRRGGTNCNMAFWLYYGTPSAVFSFHVLASTFLSQN